MAAGYWKLDLGQVVALADVPAHLGGGAFTIMRVDTRGGRTTVHFAGDSDEVTKRHAKAVATKLEEIVKLKLEEIVKP
jgi:hypothetical protein